jgi:hypothetical protein
VRIGSMFGGLHMKRAPEARAEPLQAPVSGFSVQVSGRRNIVWFFLTPET